MFTGIVQVPRNWYRLMKNPTRTHVVTLPDYMLEGWRRGVGSA